MWLSQQHFREAIQALFIYRARSALAAAVQRYGGWGVQMLMMQQYESPASSSQRHHSRVCRSCVAEILMALWWRRVKTLSEHNWMGGKHGLGCLQLCILLQHGIDLFLLRKDYALQQHTTSWWLQKQYLFSKRAEGDCHFCVPSDIFYITVISLIVIWLDALTWNEQLSNVHPLSNVQFQSTNEQILCRVCTHTKFSQMCYTN